METKIAGDLTQLLKPEYQQAGWRLSEDEDFVYLCPPSEREAYVFSAITATLDTITATIEKMQ